MATVKINTINAFDAAQTVKIKFTCSDDLAIKGNRLLIKNAASEIVFQRDFLSQWDYYNIIDGATLTNGNTYTAIIQVYQNVDMTSPIAVSDPVPFKCISTPTWEANISEDEIITSITKNLVISYASTDKEEIDNTCNIKIYDSSKLPILNIDVDSSSSTLTTTSLSKTYQYTINSMPDGTYYLQCRTSTRNGFVLDTGLICFKCEVVPTAFQLLDLSNNEFEGSVRVTSNIQAPIGFLYDKTTHQKLNDSDATYQNANTMIDLTGNEYVLYNNGYNLEGDFALHYEASHLSVNSVFFKTNLFELIWRCTPANNYGFEVSNGELVRQTNSDGTGGDWSVTTPTASPYYYVEMNLLNDSSTLSAPINKKLTTDVNAAISIWIVRMHNQFQFEVSLSGGN